MIKMEEINPAIRFSILIIVMIGVFYGGYYFLFHPISVKVEPQDNEVVLTGQSSSATPAQRYATTTNKAIIKDYVTNVTNSLKSKDVKKNPANYLIIDKIGVSAPIEVVNFDSDGNMASPTGPNVVAWYSQGAKIGSIGNAVISGHRDTEKGKAVFYRLSELVIGDTIMVTDDKGKGYRYVVDSKNNYPRDGFPSKEIFSNGMAARLNLVTCSGTYNRSTKLYSHRLVVSAVLAK